ncbi:MAG: transposase [Lachnospiraceae bacterium]|nr:transposase [Lachnospiraceae bacterium]
MAGKQKLKPDIVLKNYWNGNEEFADFFNAVLFRGKQIIQPDELEEVDTEGSTVLEHREYAESVQASRDNIKIQKKSTGLGVRLVMLGLDHQEHIHYAMPLRVMGYDYATYKKQYDSNARKYADAKGLTEDEYLSKLRQAEKVGPGITVIGYYGEKPWDGAKSLHEMLNLPEDVAEFINDYPMHLVEARNTELIFHNKNNRDLFELLQIFLNRSASGNSIADAAVKYNDDHMPDKIVFMAVAGAIKIKIDNHVY